MILYKRWNDSSYLFRKLQPITSVKWCYMLRTPVG
jgi:hypothetical protein